MSEARAECVSSSLQHSASLHASAGSAKRICRPLSSLSNIKVTDTDELLAFSAATRERLTAERWARVWRALVLAPTVEAFEALLRGEALPGDGACRARTGDPQLAKLVLSQLS